MAPQTWLVTGCSSGFGEVFVRQLRAAGENVIATGRNADTKLAHLKDTGATILDLDVSSPPVEIERIIKKAWDVYDGIDVVISNAGYFRSGAVEELTQEDMEVCMKINFHGPMNITRAVLPSMRARGSGKIVYISSEYGWHGDPSSAAYVASKFALEGAVECLASELALLAPTIKVLLVEPGYFRTNLFRNIEHVPANQPDYAQFNAGVRIAEKSFDGIAPGSPELAVERTIELVNGTGMAAGKTVPLRVPLGRDGLGRIREKCETMLGLCKEWEAVATSTDFPEANGAS